MCGAFRCGNASSLQHRLLLFTLPFLPPYSPPPTAHQTQNPGAAFFSGMCPPHAWLCCLMVLRARCLPLKFFPFANLIALPSSSSPPPPACAQRTKAKKAKKRKIRLPANYDPSKPPDPARWLPRREREAKKKGPPPTPLLLSRASRAVRNTPFCNLSAAPWPLGHSSHSLSCSLGPLAASRAVVVSLLWFVVHVHRLDCKVWR